MSKSFRTKKNLNLELENSNDNLNKILKPESKEDFEYQASQSIEL